MASPAQDIDKRWVGHLRNSSRRLVCPDCGGLEIHPPSLSAFHAHVEQARDRHPALVTDGDIQEAFDKIKQRAKSQSTSQGAPAAAGKTRSRKRPVATAAQTRARQEATPGPDERDEDQREAKKQCSPTSSVVRSLSLSHQPQQQQQSRRPPTPDRSRGRTGANKPVPALSSRKLWTPEDELPPRSAQARPQQQQQQQQQQQVNPRPSLARHARPIPTPMPTPTPTLDEDDIPEDPAVTTRVIRQPETRPISQEQLVAEVKGIYAGLVMVESKCIEVDHAQFSNKDKGDGPRQPSSASGPEAGAGSGPCSRPAKEKDVLPRPPSSKEALRQLSNEQWQALISLHRTLLHEHHDFFLASQHPSASPALRRLAAKYAMPARMWRHGIHSFLELLRHNLPASLEPMLTFIYMAYSMVALLYETVPAFEDTWIECLGDLGRYRMAIEDDDIRDRETWAAVSRYWYSKASDHAPTTGRLYHHLAILARPNALQQVYYYTKSLCVPVPFLSARDSVMTLFDPALSPAPSKMEPIDAAFVRIHAILFSGKSQEQLQPSLALFYSLLDGHIARTTKGWLESGYYIAISIANALLGYGSETNVLMRAMSAEKSEDASSEEGGDPPVPAEPVFEQTLDFAVRTYEIITRRWGDMNILPYLHTSLVFLRHLCRFPGAMAQVEGKIPWKLTGMMLNYLKQSSKAEMRMGCAAFPGAPKNEVPRPLPEDYAMRGLLYAEDYFPADWFPGLVDDAKHFELASMVDERRERILWLGRRIADADRWLRWDDAREEFYVSAAYDVDLGMERPLT